MSTRTPIVRWVQRTWQKLFGQWKEGPEAPERLSEMVLAFANAHPRATRGDWIEFAAAHGRECYRSGYVRGYEAGERIEDWRPRVAPELIADTEDPDWRWSPDITLVGPADLIVLEEQEDERGELARHVVEMNYGTWDDEEEIDG